MMKSLSASLCLGLLTCAFISACDPEGGSDAGADGGATPDGGETDGGGNAPATATTTSGDVIGSTADGVRVFRSIPYAAPPVGDLRFARPVAHEAWNTALDTREADPDVLCAQAERTTGVMRGVEDCLVLNVFAPEDASGAPVMVFIHGGGFTTGSGTASLYDGTVFAQHGVVLIAINYRLGTLGFLATSEMEQGDGGSGNFGLWDQRLALSWVRDNAAAFGGDPDNVTIFGESAGAVSVMMQMVSPGSAELVNRVIMQSGGGGFGFASQADRYPHYAPVIAALGCDGGEDVLACLRDPSLTVADFVSANTAAGMGVLGLPDVGPHVDGAFLPDDPFALVESGASDVPFMIGHNDDEATLFTRTVTVSDRDAALALLVPTYGATTAEAILGIYNETEFGSWKAAFDKFFGEVGFVCPAQALAAAGSSGAPVYSYHFTRSLRLLPQLGSFQGLELPFVFGHPDINPSFTPAPEDFALAETMNRAWATYATDGTPDFAPGWSAFDPASPSIAIFDEPPSEASEIVGGRCADLLALGVGR